MHPIFVMARLGRAIHVFFLFQNGKSWMPRLKRGMTVIFSVSWPAMTDCSYGHFTSGGMEERIEATLPPVLRPNVVPRS